MSKQSRRAGKKIYLILSAIIGGLIFSVALFAQDLPKEIRGYKVYRAKITVKNKTDKTGATDADEAFVKIGEPEVTNASITGLTLELSAEIDKLRQSGTIDFLTFTDFRVNDLQVEVEEYKESFEFKKDEIIALPKPVKIFVSVGQTLRGALKEMKESKKDWTVTGRVFVFGHFKKAGFKFKRVVPIEVNLTIKNPLRKN